MTNMKHILAALALTLCTISHAQTQPEMMTCVYNWAAPGSLTPAFDAPTSADRYGQYIGKVEFSAGPTTLYIDDSAIKEQSQAARFLYGYLTQEVEMRAYGASVIRFAADDGYSIYRIEMEGAKTGPEYLSCEDGTLRWSDPTSSIGVWEAVNTGCKVATLYVNATINCTLTRVVVQKTTGVDEITADGEHAPESWFTLQGTPLPEAPTTPGMYVRRAGSQSALQIIR